MSYESGLWRAGLTLLRGGLSLVESFRLDRLSTVSSVQGRQNNLRQRTAIDFVDDFVYITTNTNGEQ
jgi:hypothetical protein